MDGVVGSCLGDFKDSPFSDFVDERVNFLLGVIEEPFVNFKGKG